NPSPRSPAEMKMSDRGQPDIGAGITAQPGDAAIRRIQNRPMFADGDQQSLRSGRINIPSQGKAPQVRTSTGRTLAPSRRRLGSRDVEPKNSRENDEQCPNHKDARLPRT